MTRKEERRAKVPAVFRMANILKEEFWLAENSMVVGRRHLRS